MSLVWMFVGFWVGATIGFGLFAALQMSRDSEAKR